jgi:hypothetical protein
VLWTDKRVAECHGRSHAVRTQLHIPVDSSDVLWRVLKQAVIGRAIMVQSARELWNRMQLVIGQRSQRLHKQHVAQRDNKSMRLEKHCCTAGDLRSDVMPSRCIARRVSIGGRRLHAQHQLLSAQRLRHRWDE